MKILASILLVAVFSSATAAKEIKDLTAPEKATLAMLATAACMALPGSADAVKRCVDQDGHWKSNADCDADPDRLKAMLELMLSSQGRGNACKALYVEELIDKPGSTLPEGPAKENLMLLLLHQ